VTAPLCRMTPRDLMPDTIPMRDLIDQAAEFGLCIWNAPSILLYALGFVAVIALIVALELADDRAAVRRKTRAAIERTGRPPSRPNPSKRA
jgi:hypothetical protein